MHNVLQSILENTRKEVEIRKSLKGADSHKQGLLNKTLFKESLLNHKAGDIALIAEIKLNSPALGELGSKGEVLKKVLQYQEAGADAISIITEKSEFKGELNFISQVKENVALPILQKDFVIDSFQIEESKSLGADALLLIDRIVSEDELKRLVKLCKEVGVEPIVEINSEEDLEKALKSEAEIIAVNARDLDTFAVSIDKACALLKEIPESFIKLGFSGIKSREDVERYKKAGADAVLVGTGLMKSGDVNRFIKELKNVTS